jgi:hypothetical protein
LVELPVVEHLAVLALPAVVNLSLLHSFPKETLESFGLIK